MPLKEKGTLARVLMLATLVEIALRVTPLPRLSRWLGVPLGVTPAMGSRQQPTPPFDDAETRQIRTVLRLMRHWPFADGSCLRQSLVLGRLLRRRIPVLRLGVAPEGESVLAHAWIEVSGVTVGDQGGFTPFGGRTEPEGV